MIYKFNFTKSAKTQQVVDVTAIFLGILVVWEVLTVQLEVLDAFLFPSPQQVLELFIGDLPTIFRGLGSSLVLLSAAYALALATAIPLGLFVGWRRRLFNAVHPISKIMSAVPPIVYIPYAIAILPTFQLASVLVIFVGAFWPIFVSTLNATVQIDKTLIDSARMLRIKERRLLFEIILPAIMPQVLTGCSVGLIFSFILLASAEMIGATSGIGWYVKYYSDFGDYGKVIVGILFIGLVVTAVMAVFDRIQRHLLRWQAKYSAD
ncbi:NitT/TauT family transport system permease protein [Anaerovibrio lipolyticus DSM 3074]|jgi:NitT/TauT family transport system permease protein|uniref:NitT/TauT family transport system permease protein n=1 Tax=Anaerovibrio lipolyticus DSM 3074 TaxID=1120997 RepID=A0A1M6AKB4_9FIRM|nr:ABC transporter permease subunit [Anaerovibrio lipolyticus]SHI36949.1 NitT/TauT family transport system permease protein [Anaerovibrio lipolyticus DSM 3074]